jgi:hypothetical protein
MVAGGADEGRRGGEAGDSDREEDIFLRRVVFAVLVVAVACVGGWFLLATLSSARSDRPVLSVNGRPAGRALAYTVKLLDFPGANRDAAMLLAGKESLRRLAGGHRFECIGIQDGRLALCVGQFDSPDAPELRTLLTSFREFKETEGGSALFPKATVYSYPKK